MENDWEIRLHADMRRLKRVSRVGVTIHPDIALQLENLSTLRRRVDAFRLGTKTLILAGTALAIAVAPLFWPALCR